ncbi:MAG TPA: NapC/NirT family cytochrome c [Candidatus Acidoferrales bacterium]
MIGILICQIVVSIVLASIFLIRPSVTTGAAWKILAFIGLCVLPALCIVGGMNTHVQRSEQTKFCISCHVMIPYGQSLYIDDPAHIPAQHFQNHRVPPDMACFSCHADYTIYGPLKDKLQGLKRIYMQYVSTPPDPAAIRIPGGFKNEQCLHCHLGARSFEENAIHAAIMDSLTSNQMSCLTSGCHDTAHDVANLAHDKFWKPAQ